MSPHPPRKFRRIALKSPTELSHYRRLSRSPRTLAAEKCDNCRKGKSKCVPQERGCQRCFDKDLHCPGLTKPNRTRSGILRSVKPLPSSTIAAPPVPGTPHEAPSSVSSKTPASRTTASNLQPDSRCPNIGEGVTPEWRQVSDPILETPASEEPVQDQGSDESDALGEVQGLEIGLDSLDELEDLDETIDEDQNAVHKREMYIFSTHLTSLEPNKSGNLECPSCDWVFNIEFDLHDIRSHFRSCSLQDGLQDFTDIWADPFLYYRDYWLESNPVAMGETEQKEIVDKLRRRCSDIWADREQLRADREQLRADREQLRADREQLRADREQLRADREQLRADREQLRADREQLREQLRAAAQANLPSGIVFLTQLRIFCDGQLTCIGPKCKGTRLFEASYDDLKSHYESYHADFLLKDEDIGGELNVDIHLAHHTRDFQRLFAKAQVRREEWASMNEDARETEKARCKWSLECECSTYRRPQFDVLKDLNRVFRSRYQRFRRLAAESPSADLISFSHELGEKCPKPKDLRRLGTRTFKQVIRGFSPTTLLEIFAFISLSQAMALVMRRRDVQIDLDPGTVDYLSWKTCIEDEASRGLYDEILITWFHPHWKDELHAGERDQSALSVQEAMKRLVLQLMKAKQSNGAFRFSAFLKLDPFAQKHASQESTCTSRDADCEPTDSEKDDPGGSVTEALINTVIFIRVWLFMIYIAALGVALLYLSNPEQRCHLITGDGEEHVASARNVVLAAEKMKDQILDRLHQQPRIAALGIVKAVEEVLDGGYIWSVSDLHICFEKAVQIHVEEPDLRSQLYADIRHWCKEALNLVEPICERHRGGCMFVLVAV